MMETIAFPDVEATVVSHLASLVDAPVSTRVPNPRPTSFVLAFRTGGPRDSLVIDSAQLTIECWAPETVAAADLARTVRAHLGAMTGLTIGGVHVGRVAEMSGPANLPDPTSGDARYTWSIVLPVRGHAL
jgi:hypothetical protein